jgi:hypothetical protein
VGLKGEFLEQFVTWEKRTVSDSQLDNLSFFSPLALTSNSQAGQKIRIYAINLTILARIQQSLKAISYLCPLE